MARIAGVNLPEDKKIRIALTYIYGIGNTAAMQVLSQANVPAEKRVKELSDQEVKRIATTVSDKPLEGDLREIEFRNIKRLKDIKSYRGIRHKLGLPVRGQNTRSNAVTRKGRNLAVGGLKRKIEKT